MSKLRKSGGFTLIELLVVIAIIGILSTIVLASLNTARSKGADAAIKADLAGARTQAEIVYDAAPGCYAMPGTCAGLAANASSCTAPAANTIFNDPKISSMIAGAVAASGSAGVCVSNAGGTGWAVSVSLKSNPALAWCVDNNGTSKQYSGTPTAATSGGICN